MNIIAIFFKEQEGALFFFCSLKTKKGGDDLCLRMRRTKTNF